ncbi:MAG: hypothetical protein ACQEST_03675 [Bacteroidota bacterium]
MRILAISFIVFFITACASSLPPAEPTSKMMDEADAIILTIEGDPETVYRDLQKHFGNQEFTVIESEEHPNRIETQYKTFGPLMLGIWGSYSMKITAQVNESSITFRGDLRSGTEVQNSGGKNSPMRSGWDKMVEIAQQFPHQEIYFSRN